LALKLLPTAVPITLPMMRQHKKTDKTFNFYINDGTDYFCDGASETALGMPAQSNNGQNQTVPPENNNQMNGGNLFSN
jgi:hypothetical protein